MANNEKFCLRWNDFESNISTAFRELRDDKDFFDVTLACDDEQIQAHKVILSACSPFFRNVLRRNPHQHPLLYLKNVKYSDLQSVLNFMYHGEVNVAQEELNSFLAVAEDLRVKGLTQNTQSSSNSNNINHQRAKSPAPPPVRSAPRPPDRDPIPQIKRQRPQPPAPQPQPTHYSQAQDDDIQEVVPVKSEPREPAPPAPAPAMYNHPATPIQQHVEQQQQGHELAPPPVEEHAMEAYEGEGYEDYGYEGEEGYDGVMDQSMDGNKDGTDKESMMAKLQDGSGYMCLLCNKVRLHFF